MRRSNLRSKKQFKNNLSRGKPAYKCRGSRTNDPQTPTDCRPHFAGMSDGSDGVDTASAKSSYTTLLQTEVAWCSDNCAQGNWAEFKTSLSNEAISGVLLVDRHDLAQTRSWRTIFRQNHAGSGVRLSASSSSFAVDLSVALLTLSSASRLRGCSRPPSGAISR